MSIDLHLDVFKGNAGIFCVYTHVFYFLNTFDSENRPSRLMER